MTLHYFVAACLLSVLQAKNETVKCPKCGSEMLLMTLDAYGNETWECDVCFSKLRSRLRRSVIH